VPSQDKPLRIPLSSNAPGSLNNVTLKDFLIANKGYVLALFSAHMFLLLSMTTSAYSGVIPHDWLPFTYWYLVFLSFVLYFPTFCYLTIDEQLIYWYSKRRTLVHRNILSADPIELLRK